MIRSVARRLRNAWSRFLLIVAFLGPGVITGNVDNDAGGLTTYSVIGARYGYDMLWILVPATVALAVIQEMAARMGTVTGKGLSDLIRERFGLRATVFAMLLLVFGNLATTISEFAGVAAASEILGIPKYVAVPLAALVVWILVLRGSYRVVERVFLALSAVYFSYVAAGFMAKPAWNDVFVALVTPRLKPELEFIVLLIATLGTTITPWMQFYHQAM
ncbi:MAG TPA: Nramp family divalent metal transporter, partial [Clostridia bacterium]|nr:Nramp family divalent metal transporter [Clostridia bacterium]